LITADTRTPRSFEEGIEMIACRLTVAAALAVVVQPIAGNPQLIPAQ
jgi:hypothetical protein